MLTIPIMNYIEIRGDKRMVFLFKDKITCWNCGKPFKQIAEHDFKPMCNCFPKDVIMSVGKNESMSVTNKYQ